MVSASTVQLVTTPPPRTPNRARPQQLGITPVGLKLVVQGPLQRLSAPPVTSTKSPVSPVVHSVLQEPLRPHSVLYVRTIANPAPLGLTLPWDRQLAQSVLQGLPLLLALLHAVFVPWGPIVRLPAPRLVPNVLLEPSPRPQEPLLAHPALLERILA